MDSLNQNYQTSEYGLDPIFQQTIHIVNTGSYVSRAGLQIKLDDDREMRENTRFYQLPFTVYDIPPYPFSTSIQVINSDSIEAGKRLVLEGFRPAVLNFANRTNAGGGVLWGAKSQEESLFRRTNLFRSLFQFTNYANEYNLPRNRRQYPMDGNFGGIYTPYATVFRGIDSEGNPLLEQPFKMSFISVAAMLHPKLVNNRIADSLIPGVKNKIRTIFRIGLFHGHDSLVLGAFGCGAFRNPPRHIAELFKEVLAEKEFHNKYRKIVFAIIEDCNSGGTLNPNGNLKPFMDVFLE